MRFRERARRKTTTLARARSGIGKVQHGPIHGQGNLQPEDAIPSLRTLRHLGIRLLPDTDLWEDALMLAADHGITVYDALFCALTARENVQLITSDNPLVRRLAGTDIQATVLSEWNGSR